MKGPHSGEWKKRFKGNTNRQIKESKKEKTMTGQTWRVIL